MPTISLCMITKNEELFLEQALNSVKDLVNEIIIVDTGSTDSSLEIAKKFTDKIYNFRWNDNFADARNESLKKANSEWILVLDADEVISKKDHEKIKKLLEEKKSLGFSLCQRNYTNNANRYGFVFSKDDEYQEKKSYLGWFDSWIVRLFKNDDRLRFKGEVHERIEPSLKDLNEKPELVPIPIHHYADEKSDENKKERVNFYRNLAETKVKNNPEDADANFQLGVLYKEGGDFEKAEQALKKSISLNEKLITPYIDLGVVLQKQNKNDEAIQTYFKVIEKDPNNAEAHFGLGFCYFKKGDLESSEKNFKLAINHNPNLIDAYINLGAIYERQTKFMEAIHILERVIKTIPNQPRAHFNLGVIYEKLKILPKALENYQKAIDLNYKKKYLLKPRVEKMKEVLKEG